jgi:hypothetical protein
MRILLILWATPMSIFWGWYYLSLNDINFGYLMLSRQVHDFVFQLYGQILGIDPSTIPTLILRACIFDTLIIAGIWAFRRRREIMAWWRGRNEEVSDRAGSDPALPAE